MTNLVSIVSTQPSNILDIGWDPSNFCNFKCRYCFPEANAATHRFADNVDLVVKNFQNLLDYYTTHRGKTKFRFFVAGGEPTLWKDLETFISKIKERHDVYFTLVSNGSRTIRWWKENAHLIDNAHLTHHLGEGNVKHITEVADILHEAGSKTTVKVLMDSTLWDQGISDIEYMKTHSRYKWFIMTAEVLENNYLNNYTLDQLKYLKKDLKRTPTLLWFWKNKNLIKEEIRYFDSVALTDTGKKIRARPGTYFNKGLNFFLGWKCSIGFDRIYIKWTGSISGGCGAKLFDLAENFNILSPTFVNDFHPEFKLTTCSFNQCWCSPETHVTKKRVIPISSS
jgi:organic radical activating enzyme